ncbi:MAG: AraC family transcriptional regulator [Alicycliphilus sp.]|uniref:AraC family transcriptional regulator n=1 Tax=Diaphorobacter limosus TaxID=3036128 RepID=A0ABZ0J2K8_9BURK|nr:AraC family transcriptional regulator [Diaphorobacter sp. Y-1]MBP7328380.1 AraC family transcriptional regulator [Alicycliphilus sp.]MCA0442249.1 AraC family transcriptional regulator [Pseudomonadota bacterium]MBP8778868.1 AraC family transcriptional regulator [Alicycliphilus sp.]WOO31790.1 AraC family transcriptional regulator [Diaphorobacter sp. Y-1]HRM49332.1 AraC family transcriptional regulator [Alicycliphilus sp.]
MTLQATVSMGWVGTVLAAAERQGVARGALLAQAGIAPEELTAERWPIDHITRLWRAAVHCTQDAGFGLKAGAGVGPASFNVVSYLLQSAPTLRAALALVQKYQRLISDGGRFQTITGPEACWVVYHPRQGALAFSPHQIESVLAAVVVFARWVTGSALRPQRVQLSQARIGPLAGYREVFQCPVDFEQAFSGVLLANAQLDAPLPQANAQLAQAHQQQAAARLAALSRQDGLEQTLRMWIASQLQGQAPARAQAARALGLSERTLARRMRAEGLSYSALLDGVRRDAALQAVAQTTRALSDIALALGYAEPSVFTRAFRRWTGATPGQWRGRGAADMRAQPPAA